MTNSGGPGTGWNRRPSGSGLRRVKRVPRTVVPEDREVILDRAVWRMTVLKSILFFGLGVLGVRAGFLMLMEDERLQEKAARQFQQRVTVEAPRGEIFARDGEILATTVEMPALHADPSRLDPASVDELAGKLAEILEADEARLARQLRRFDRRDVTLSRQVSPDKLELIRGLAPRRVLWSRSVSTRYYPGRDFAAQLLGVVGHHGGGLEGLELSLDSYLRGGTFTYVQERDREGRAISAAPGMRQMARPGDSVHLTLHRGVQQAAERALEEAMERSEPIAASAVVIDVATGEVLALARCTR